MKKELLSELVFKTFELAAESGDIKICEYLHKINAPINSDTFEFALDNQHSEICKYLININAPIDNKYKLILSWK